MYMKIPRMTLRYIFWENEMLHKILISFFSSSVEGLHAIVVSDRDGVPVIKGKTVPPCQCRVCFWIKTYLGLSGAEGKRIKAVSINLGDGLSLGGDVCFCMWKASLELITYYVLNDCVTVESLSRNLSQA